MVLQVRSEVFAAVATPATAGERPRLWELMVSAVPKYVSYGKKACRALPVVVVARR